MVAAVIGLTAVSCGSDGSQQLVGYELDPVRVVGDLSLPDAAADGRPMSFSGAPGGLLVTFFGYTNCPDICPTTMASLRSAMTDLGDDAAYVDVAMVTIDPDRDTATVLTDYVHGFVTDGHALRSDDPTALRSVADRFGVDYVVRTAADGSVEVAHSSVAFVVDDVGQIAAVWPFGTTSSDMASDLELLLGRSRT